MLTPAPLQTSYTQYMPVAQLGMPGSMTPYNIDTRIMEDPTGNGVGFGLAVSQGTLHGDKSVAIGELSGGAFVGITCADPTLYNGGAHVDKYGDGDDAAILTFGDRWVAPATNVVSGHQVYFNSATGELGDSSIANATAIPNSRWIDSKPNTDQQPTVNFNGLARVRLGSMR